MKLDNKHINSPRSAQAHGAGLGSGKQSGARKMVGFTHYIFPLITSRFGKKLGCSFPDKRDSVSAHGTGSFLRENLFTPRAE